MRRLAPKGHFGCARLPGESLRNDLMPPKVLELLPFPDEFGLAIVDKYLCTPRTGIVITGHGETVRPSAIDCDDVPLFDLWKCPIMRDIVSGFTDRPYNLVLRDTGLVELVGNRDIVVRIVHSGSNESVETGIHTCELLDTCFLDIDTLGQKNGGITDYVPSGLQCNGLDVRFLLDGFGDQDRKLV